MAYATSIWNQTGKQFACATEMKRKITKYRGVLEKPSEIQIPLKVEGYVKEWEGVCVCAPRLLIILLTCWVILCCVCFSILHPIPNAIRDLMEPTGTVIIP